MIVNIREQKAFQNRQLYTYSYIITNNTTLYDRFQESETSKFTLSVQKHVDEKPTDLLADSPKKLFFDESYMYSKKLQLFMILLLFVLLSS